MVEPCGFTASKSKVRTILELTHSEGVVAEQRVDNRRLDFVTVGGSRIKPSRVVVSLCSTIVTFTWMVTLEWTSTLLELTHSEGVVAEQRVDNRRLDFVTVGGSRIKPSRVVVSLCSTIVTFTWTVTLEWTSTLLGGWGGGGSAIPSTASCHKASMPA